MTFEALLREDISSQSFGSAPYLRTFKKRPHISRSKMEAYSGCSYLKFGDFFSRKDYDNGANRYVCAQSLIYELLFSVYDVNTRAIAIARMADFGGVEQRFISFIKSVKNPNFEVRVIGMQTGHNLQGMKQAADFIAKNRLKLFEADLFGANVRHVALDIDTGMCFNVLVEDRLYKPGELASTMTMEQFERSLKTEAAGK